MQVISPGSSPSSASWMSGAAQTAKIFSNGGSQAVRLPAEFRFDTKEVFIRRDERTQDVILSVQPRMAWADFAAFCAEQGALAELDDFAADLQNSRRVPSAGRDPFEGWVE